MERASSRADRQTAATARNPRPCWCLRCLNGFFPFPAMIGFCLVSFQACSTGQSSGSMETARQIPVLGEVGNQHLLTVFPRHDALGRSTLIEL
jgi:hypothetical protein